MSMDEENDYEALSNVLYSMGGAEIGTRCLSATGGFDDLCKNETLRS